MKAELINPFLEASQSVINTLLNTDANLGKIYLKPSPYFTNSVIIVIGVVGDFKGQIYFEMTLEIAKKIAGRMLSGNALPALDEVGKSAVSEMGNMIAGNACTLYEHRNIHIDITPPSLITGEKIEISNKVPTIVIPLLIDDIGLININAVMEKMN